MADVLKAEDNFRKWGYNRNKRFQGNASYGGRYRYQREAVVLDWFWKHQEEQRIKSEERCYTGSSGEREHGDWHNKFFNGMEEMKEKEKTFKEIFQENE